MKLRHDTQGTALVEFTVLLPFFMLLVFGIVEAGFVMWAQTGLQHSVEMAARCASVSDVAISLDPTKIPTPCYNTSGNATANATAVKAYASAVTTSWGLTVPTSDFSVNPASPPCPGGNLVSASYPFTAIRYLYTITVKAQSCFSN